jgi:hypothetical protein
MAWPRGPPQRNGSAQQPDSGLEVRTVLLTFLALFLALAVGLAFTISATPNWPRYGGLLGLVALPVVLVIGLALGVRLYLRRAPFSDAAPAATREGTRGGDSAPPTGAVPGGPAGRHG